MCRWTAAGSCSACGSGGCIPSPSQADPARNRHRTGEGWAKSAVKSILANPRYTGHQVWNRQRKDEVLLDVANVADGYETKMRWNDKGSWVWSEKAAHEPLVSVEDFEAAQTIQASSGRTRIHREWEVVRRAYVLRGRLRCGLCQRKMQGQLSHDAAYCRCRYPKEYALANHVQHPSNVLLREDQILPVLDRWLIKAFAPHRIGDTVRAMAAAQSDSVPTAAPETEADIAAVIAACDAKLEKYRAALEAGVDPETVGAWITTVKAERAAALAHATVRQTRAESNWRMTEDDIRRIIDALVDIRDILQNADPEDKAEIYNGLGLRLTYQPTQQIVRAEVDLDPNDGWVMVRVRGGT
ncbi:MAG: Recombinase [Mycobacterium sp.]|nr:Recombinase [Mycobacterium sp.]